MQRVESTTIQQSVRRRVPTVLTHEAGLAAVTNCNANTYNISGLTYVHRWWNPQPHSNLYGSVCQLPSQEARLATIVLQTCTTYWDWLMYTDGKTYTRTAMCMETRANRP